jgi:hemolysin III
MKKAPKSTRLSLPGTKSKKQAAIVSPFGKRGFFLDIFCGLAYIIKLIPKGDETMETKEQYKAEIKSIKKRFKEAQENLKSSYIMKKKSDQIARKTLHRKAKTDQKEYHLSQKDLRDTLDIQLEETKKTYKSGESFEAARNKRKAEAEAVANEEPAGFNKKSSSPDYTTCLSAEDLAALRKANKLPSYTKGEEIFNSVTHIVGGGLGVLGLIAGVICAAIYKPGNAAIAWSMAIFGLAMVTLYTISAVYHGLHVNKGKKVLQIIDHCTIYFLIAGTYTPLCLICLTNIAPFNYVLMGVIYAMDALGIVLNATMMDKKPVKVVSQILYIATGWICVFFYPYLIQTLTVGGMWLLIGGGISYTVGAVFYAFGRKVKYMHSIFHLFVIVGTVLQYLGILLYGVIGVGA